MMGSELDTIDAHTPIDALYQRYAAHIMTVL